MFNDSYVMTYQLLRYAKFIWYADSRIACHKYFPPHTCSPYNTPGKKESSTETIPHKTPTTAPRAMMKRLTIRSILTPLVFSKTPASMRRLVEAR
mmetsp:Transcript_22293/g.48218  ORF Transcript_22293/g.48218 Transcript_22293/m.48218 type:complete len:95 (-) Transcript_22293:1365-1649(-)